MKLISYRFNGENRYGAVKEDGVVDLATRLGAEFPTLREALSPNGLERLRTVAEGAEADHALADLQLSLPIPNARKIFCAGRNYRGYHEVIETGKTPTYPSIFGRFLNGFSAHGEEILKPKVGEQFDYEGELVAIIGTRGRHIPEGKALDYVAGYTIMNEGSVRDWMKMGTQNTPAKNFYRSGSIGPWMVPAGGVGDPARQHIFTRVNGLLRQDSGTEMMIFDTRYLVAHISRFTWLEPGDMIATGSPGGSISGSKDPQWLKPGDVVEVEIPAIGILSNPVGLE